MLLTLTALTAAAQNALPVIAVGGIGHESLPFNPAVTGLADFGWPRKIEREAWLRETAVQNTIPAGYIEGAQRYGLDLRPTVLVSATPKGPSRTRPSRP